MRDRSRWQVEIHVKRRFCEREREKAGCGCLRQNSNAMKPLCHETHQLTTAIIRHTFIENNIFQQNYNV
jgi:hypothetical protein